MSREWLQHALLSLLLAVAGLWLALPGRSREPAFLIEVVGDVERPGSYLVAQPEVALALAAAGTPALARGPLRPGQQVRIHGQRVLLGPSTDPPLLGAPIDLNEAPAQTLALVPGIGPGRARALVAHRERYGPFYSTSEAAWVKGLGPYTVERATPWLVVADRGPRPPPAPLDLNTATLAQLQRLPRVGPVLAQRITAHRPFRSLEDAARVPGIGPGTLSQWRGKATVGSRDKGPS